MLDVVPLVEEKLLGVVLTFPDDCVLPSVDSDEGLVVVADTLGLERSVDELVTVEVEDGQ